MEPTFFTKPSAELDQYFGLDTNGIETQLINRARKINPEASVWGLGQGIHEGHQTWVGLDPQTLNTPYEELLLICDYLKPMPGQKMIDLGAGYGRLGIILHKLYPGVIFEGFEYVPERVDEGQRVFEKLGARFHSLKTQDITSEEFVIPVAEFYFLYDFGDVSAIRKVLSQLSLIADRHKFVLIARGKGSRSLIDHEFPWLVKEHSHENFSIYR